MVLLSYYYSIIMKGAKVAINSRSNLINHNERQIPFDSHIKIYKGGSHGYLRKDRFV